MDPSISGKSLSVRHGGVRVVGVVLVLALMFVLAGAIAAGAAARTRARVRLHAAIKMGGVLKVGIAARQRDFDPALHSDNVADIMVQEQI